MMEYILIYDISSSRFDISSTYVLYFIVIVFVLTLFFYGIYISTISKTFKIMAFIIFLVVLGFIFEKLLTGFSDRKKCLDLLSVNDFQTVVGKQLHKTINGHVFIDIPEKYTKKGILYINDHFREVNNIHLPLGLPKSCGFTSNRTNLWGIPVENKKMLISHHFGKIFRIYIEK